MSYLCARKNKKQQLKRNATNMKTMKATLKRVNGNERFYKLDDGQVLATITTAGSFLKRTINPIIRDMRSKHADYIFVQFADGRNFTAHLSKDKHYHEFNDIRFVFVA